MTCIAPANAGAPVGPVATPCTTRGAPGAVSLLPEPMLSATGIEDLYAVMAEMSSVQADVGKGRVEHAGLEKRKQVEEHRKALERAEEAAKGGFLKFLGPIGKLAMAVAAAAAIVCTAGAGATAVVGVGVAMSAGGFVVGETKCLDAIFGEGASAWIGAGLSLAGSAVMGFGGALPGGQLGDLSQGISSTGQALQGAHQIDSACAAHRADLAMIDAKAAQQAMDRLDRLIDEVITQLEDNKDSSRRHSAAVNEIAEAQGATLLIAAGGRA